MIITAPFEPVTILPIGTVLMYHGAGINNVAGRSLPLGLDPLDTIGDIPYGGWYCCNGNAGTPHLLNYMIRSEAVSGNTGGSDVHTLTVNEMPSHKHISTDFYTTAGSVNYPCATGANVHRDSAARDTTFTGGGNPHNNIPAYFSLIFIIRIA